MDKDAIHRTFSDRNKAKSETRNNRIPRKAPNVLNTKDILVNNAHTKEEVQRDISECCEEQGFQQA